MFTITVGDTWDGTYSINALFTFQAASVVTDHELAGALSFLAEFEVAAFAAQAAATVVSAILALAVKFIAAFDTQEVHAGKPFLTFAARTTHPVVSAFLILAFRRIHGDTNPFVGKTLKPGLTFAATAVTAIIATFFAFAIRLADKIALTLDA